MLTKISEDVWIDLSAVEAVIFSDDGSESVVVVFKNNRSEMTIQKPSSENLRKILNDINEQKNNPLSNTHNYNFIGYNQPEELRVVECATTKCKSREEDYF